MSAAIAALFGAHGQEYRVGVGAYRAAEAFSGEQNLLNAVNAAHGGVVWAPVCSGGMGDTGGNGEPRAAATGGFGGAVAPD